MLLKAENAMTKKTASLPFWILGFGRRAPPVAQKPGLQRDEAVMNALLCVARWNTLKSLKRDHGRIMKG